ncbi:MAG: glycerol-3-phosphate acyltransferase, partial [Chlamydiae bacterium]|nr:glycerol-3-phosphate acyltransferase [Chlamydiota bacterium]
MINPSKPKYSVEDFFHKLQDYETRQLIPHRACVLVKTFFTSYVAALQGTSHNLTDYLWIFLDYLDLIKKQIETPYAFEPYHKRLTTPYDYHLFGIEFFRPLIDEELSSLQGQDSLQELAHHVTEGGNVILFANHQIEADPQVLHLSLEKSHPELMSHLVFVAGERVITDPLAVPFSLGCNLLCIYSKRYIDYPPEKKTLKQHHNQRTMKLMHALLDEGGHCIYVAPSG